jgi:fructokinase
MKVDPGPTIFGEVLFDCFPDGSRVLGGAPFNVAWHLQAFGLAPRLVSRVGNDRDGEQVRSAMRDWGMVTADLQTDPSRPTGKVEVSFSDGEPAYQIVADCAYDHITPVQSRPVRLLYHGSLAVRAPTSSACLAGLRAAGPQTVFIDVNLRPPWWRADDVHALLTGADWVKLNSDELALLGDGTSDSTAARDFLARYRLQGLLVTRGAGGANLLLANGEHIQVAPLAGIPVIDTVGAGDALASVMLLGLLSDWPLATALQRAQQFASAIVGRRGATIAERDFYQAFARQWQLAPNNEQGPDDV